MIKYFIINFMSIPDLQNKIKSTIPIDNSTIIVSLIIILVSSASFVLGRMSIHQQQEKGDNTYKRETTGLLMGSAATAYTSMPYTQKESTTEDIHSNTQEGQYIASKNGKLYYTVGCKAGNRLSEKTKIYFHSADEAIRAGYSPAPSCK